MKPHIVTGGEESDNCARTLDTESPFSIDPQNGVLEASGIANFLVTFAPPEVGA